MSKPFVSFEFFPPGNEAGARDLMTCVGRLARLRPSFLSVTYGADGSTRDRTLACVAQIGADTGVSVVPHLTCVGASRAEVQELAKHYWRLGVRHVVALRGDPPESSPAGARRYQPHPDGFAYASDLVAGLARTAPFEISVAAYPEGHPESDGVEADLINLRRKVDAGATRAITQFIFDTDLFLAYRDRCAASGVKVRLVPGILPITRMPQLLRFAERCGATVPAWLRRRFDGLDDDAETRRMIAASIAIEQVQRLREHGVEEFHFYTLNRADLTYAVCHAMGLRPQEPERAAADRMCLAKLA
jgi:methylenetetrahydrofolate reductase (NADPH)